MDTEKRPMFCAQCGNKLENSDQFCVYCGTPVRRPAVDVPQPRVEATPVSQTSLNPQPAVEAVPVFQTSLNPQPGAEAPSSPQPQPVTPDDVPADTAGKRRKYRIISIALICAIVVMAGALCVSYFSGKGESSRNEESAQTGEERNVYKMREFDWNEYNDWDSLWTYGGEPILFGIPELKDIPLDIITFRDSMKGAPKDAWDLSEDEDGSVLAWMNEDSTENELIIAANGTILAPGNCSSLFSLANVHTINFNNCLDTSQVTDMSFMFDHCTSLEYLNLSSFDTGNVTDMSWMFNGCTSLEQLDLSNFDTGNVADMSWMFIGCTSLEQLDLSNFNTGNVTNMMMMFCNCTSLKQLDLSNFDTGNVINMHQMFDSCTSLEQLDLCNFDTGNVTDMEFMFSGCTALRSIQITAFDLSSAENTEDMFSDCDQLDLDSISFINGTP